MSNMGCITFLLLMLTGILLLFPEGRSIIFMIEYWWLIGLFWIICFLIWLLFGDIIDAIAGVERDDF
jgi:hypothetical protein